MIRWRCLLALPAAFGLYSLGGCGSSTPPGFTPTVPSGQNVRFIDAIPDVSNVDIYVDKALVASGVAYTATTTYLPVSAGSHTYMVTKSAVASDVLIPSTSITVAANTNYTVFAVGESTNEKYPITGEALTDPQTGPTAGNVEIRIVNASPVAGSVDAYVVVAGNSILSSTPVARGLVYPPTQAASSYVVVPAGSRNIVFTNAGTTTLVANSGPVTLTSGSIVSAGLFGDPAVSKPLSSLIPTTLEMGKVRIYNYYTSGATGSFAAPEDVSGNTDVLYMGLPVAYATDYLPVPVGTDTFQLLTTKSDAAVATESLSVASGTDSSIFFGPDNTTVTTADATVSPAPNAQLRIVNFTMVSDLNTGAGGASSLNASDIYINGKRESSLSFGQAGNYITLAPGNYLITLLESGFPLFVSATDVTTAPLIVTELTGVAPNQQTVQVPEYTKFVGAYNISLAAGQVRTLVATGSIQFPLIPLVAPFPDDPSPLGLVGEGLLPDLN